ncbi:PREDICTED: uncharacterized protein LOC107193471 [Dufourea novaeangliae]|uniref:uncharacterized protein LOC107193471 n=1 Tax=Dufourea novaeangliae TaxID=178035 RepID=UPI000767740D|nr:PREDICTED: uncharacterized protein LOC107193471 [Dufourea novaeangliae]
MASMCGSTKSYPALNTGSYYRPGAYPYQNDYYLPPRSTWSRVSPQQTKKQRGNTTWKVGSAMLIISAMLVLIAVFAVAGLALWMGALRTDSKNAIVGFSCSFRVAKGEKYNPMLKLNTSMVFREKERKYKNIFELLFRRSVLNGAYQKTIVDKFENGVLRVFFRIYLDRRKVPRSITNVEDTIEDIIAKETYSSSSLFKDMELDLTTISVKRINQDASGGQKQAQQRNAMITKNGLLRPSRNNSLITSPKPKPKPSKPESSEPEIDFSNIPTIQGTYKASKVNTTGQAKANATQETAKTQSDSKNSTKISLLQDPSTTEIPSIPTTVITEISHINAQTTSLKITEKVNHTAQEHRPKETVEEPAKRIVPTSTTSTTQEQEDIFKDFRKPDLETSPWKPIVPGYVNTEFKLLPDGKTNYKVNYSNTNAGDVRPEASIRVQSDTPETSTTPSPEAMNPYVDVPGMSGFDIEDTDFPHDRIVPQEMVNFRVNGKFKNKIPGLMEDGQIFTAPSVVTEDRPEIEVSGQLPSETYNIKLRTSPERAESSFTKPYRSTSENETGWRVSGTSVSYTINEGGIKDGDHAEEVARTPDSIVENGRQDQNSTGLLTTIGTSTPKSRRPVQANVETTTIASRVGVAVPVPDTDVELEPRHRYSDIQTITAHNGALQDRKVDKNGQEPVYTSYKTPELNGAGLKPSLVEISGTLKPFRHTIPVDKISSVVSYVENDKNRQGVNTVTDRIFNNENDRLTVDAKRQEGSSKMNATVDDQTILLPKMGQIVEMETFMDTSRINIPMKNAKVELSDGVRSTEPSTQGLIDDGKFLKLGTTEVYSEIVQPANNNVDRLILKNEDAKIPPGRLTPGTLRNSTFIEIDTLQHTPGDIGDTNGPKDTLSENTEEASDWIPNGTLSKPSSFIETRKKVYNDTLKAYVVENLVTLAPAKSHTGVGRPIRPRPKLDKEKLPKIVEKPSSRDSSEDAILLEQLFGVQSRDRNTTKRHSSQLDQSDESHRGHPKIEQIVEVVTSISTKVSSNLGDDPVILRLMITNSTSIPVIHSGHQDEETSTPPISIPQDFSADSQEEDRSFRDHRPEVSRDSSKGMKSSESSSVQTSDRKISAIEESQYLLEKLKQLAEIGTDDKPVKSNKNNSKPAVNLKLDATSQARPLNFDKLKEIADIATGSEMLMNSSAGFTMTRDGVEIFTKILNKMEDRADKMISTTEKSREADDCNGFLCRDGKCLPASGRCNMLGECTNSEDEANCTCADFLKAQLLHQKICDGIADCWDYSDEADCDWCKEGQFVCGNSRTCVDQDKVCNGFTDCPEGEDEKKCAALIEDDALLNYNREDTSDTTENNLSVPVTKNAYLLPQDFPETESSTNKDAFFDQEAVESAILESTTLTTLKNDAQLEKFKNSRNESVNKEDTLTDNSNSTVFVSGREISSNGKDTLTHGNSIHVAGEKNGSSSTINFRKEINNYNEKGYINIRKNGKWGKLCLTGMDGLFQGRQASWSIEDLGRKTYQDYETVEKVLDEYPVSSRSYYTLSYNEKPLDKTILTFKPSMCPSGEVLRVKCKNLECGIRTQAPSQARIVGGGSSSAGSWPWQVALYKEGDYQCGGALINDRWILSAAHCFYHAQDEYWVARIGATRRGSFPSPYEQVLRLDYISLYPEYIDNGFINDIAMLRLEKPVIFSDYVRPICLPEAEPKSGTMCTVTGWGQLFEIGRIFPDTLQEVQLPVISTEECRRKTLFLPLYRITSGMLCAGLKDGGRDACLGDSGGPLVCSGSDNKYTLHGITSNGYGCARPGRPGVYTKVHHYLPWIEHTISRDDIRSTMVSCKGHRCPLGECLPKSRVCNGFLECSDGSDERNCPVNL